MHCDFATQAVIERGAATIRGRVIFVRWVVVKRLLGARAQDSVHYM